MRKGQGGLVRRFKGLGSCAIAALMLAGCGSDSGSTAGLPATSTPTPTPGSTPTPTPTSAPTPTPTATPTPVPTPAPLPSGGSRDPATNTYAIAATQFMAQLHLGFLKVNNTAGSTVKLYAETGSYDSTKPGGIAKDSAAAFLWSEANMIRALYWGARIDSTQFKPLLANAILQTDWYHQNRAGCLNAYGFSNTGACLFDDNSILGGALMDAYLDVLSDDNNSYLHAKTAIDYLYVNRDAQGGVPQDPVDKGQGKFYMAPVVRMAQAYVDYATRNPNATTAVGNAAAAWALGEAYFTQINDPALGLKLDSGLFRGQTTYVGPGNVWNPSDVGPLGGSQANVAALALSLYRHSHDPAKLQYAQNLTAAAVAKYVDSNGGVSQFASNGGYAMVDMLCDMYMTDHDEKWYNTAKKIVDFLLTNGRDTGGYFADGAPNNDGTPANSAQWNDVRTGMAPDPSIKLLPQSAAAAALLEFAYIDLHRGQGG